METTLNNETNNTNTSLKLIEKYNEVFQGFSKLDRDERLKSLIKLGSLTGEDVEFLKAGSPIDIELAEKFIEN